MAAAGVLSHFVFSHCHLVDEASSEELSEHFELVSCKELVSYTKGVDVRLSVTCKGFGGSIFGTNDASDSGKLD